MNTSSRSRSLSPKGVLFTDLDGTLLDQDTYDFSPALPALEAARSAGVPVVLCSSKTRAEMVLWQQRLQLAGPFVSENGGGIFLTGGGPLEEQFPERLADLPAVVLGTRYDELREALRDLRAIFGMAVRGFGDMGAGEIAGLTGLPSPDADLARQRDFDEPFLWLVQPGEEQLDEVRSWLSRRKLQMLRGGRLWHLIGGNDKGTAVQWVLDAYCRAYDRRPLSLALGDSENDLQMLHVADRGVLVERPGKGHLEGAHPCIERVPGVGPAGWARAVLAWLEEIGGEGPSAGGPVAPKKRVTEEALRPAAATTRRKEVPHGQP